jgi:hypothetical protein
MKFNLTPFSESVLRKVNVRFRSEEGWAAAQKAGAHRVSRVFHGPTKRNSRRHAPEFIPGCDSTRDVAGLKSYYDRHAWRCQAARGAARILR